MIRLRNFVLVASVVGLCGCPPNPPYYSEPDIDESMFVDKLGEAMPSASAVQLETFERGRAVAQRRFTTDDGLGPQFNATFCGACHEQPAIGGSAPRYRDFFLEGVKFDDGSVIMLGVNGVLNHYSVEEPFHVRTNEDANLLIRRNAIPFFGVGALARIDEKAILANADEFDTDGDGISGRPNYDRGFVGRFGRKAQTVSIEGFIRGPLFNHAGITTAPLPDYLRSELPIPSAVFERPNGLRNDALTFCPTCQAAAPDEPTVDNDDVPDPEMGDEDLFDLVTFVMLMGAAKPDAELSDAAKSGKRTFDDIGCASCHVSGLEGDDGYVLAYSDLLLHDMGEDMADGLEQGIATGSEFRTQPLWGIAPVGPYLHDGRADTLDQAILFHGGEGEASRDAYEDLSDAEQQEVIEFMISLGGGDQVTDGLLPPFFQAPELGEIGGPGRELTPEESAKFDLGRRVFDRDFTVASGLGSRFNGDSCRACHFDPIIGGAGPADVNVTRQSIWQADSGGLGAPSGGTMVHRHSVILTERPGSDDTSNVFEFRQTPPIFGLGLVDRIPDENILANEDPTDADRDGIRGVARIMEDGRVGKFGWKSGLPTLEDFVRDALSNEVGLTLPGGNFIAGNTTDSDDQPDPELSGEDYDALVFFNENLGAPRRTNTSSALVERGEQVFDDLECSKCHIPTLFTSDGAPVRLYSDLLLHDVQDPSYIGIADGSASGRLFRTAPLWGISRTGPYMHDGLAPTLEAAIRRHDGTALQSAEDYEALTPAARAALMEFLDSL